MKTVTAAEMQEIDRKATELFGIPAILLMENAGRSGADFISKRSSKAGKAVIFCGKGNNGGDGLVIARHLTNRGWKISVYLLGDPAKLKPGPLVNYQIVLKMGIPIFVIRSPDDFLEINAVLDSADLIIDALFGIGVSRPLSEPYVTAIKDINQSKVPVYAIDIPSGLNADTGGVCGAAVRATFTLALGFSKTGLYLADGPRFSGEIEILDIGLPVSNLP